jgi:hypothetical protein
LVSSGGGWGLVFVKDAVNLAHYANFYAALAISLTSDLGNLKSQFVISSLEFATLYTFSMHGTTMFTGVWNSRIADA